MLLSDSVSGLKRTPKRWFMFIGIQCVIKAVDKIINGNIKCVYMKFTASTKACIAICGLISKKLSFLDSLYLLIRLAYTQTHSDSSSCTAVRRSLLCRHKLVEWNHLSIVLQNSAMRRQQVHRIYSFSRRSREVKSFCS